MGPGWKPRSPKTGFLTTRLISLFESEATGAPADCYLHWRYEMLPILEDFELDPQYLLNRNQFRHIL